MSDLHGEPPLPAPGVPGGTPALPVPPGPGVRPPFAAPPTQRDRRRLWAGIAVGAAAIVLCGVGSLAGCLGLGVWLVAEQQRESRAAVQRYLDPLVAGEYPKAYRAQCSALRDQETVDEYATQASNRPRLLGYGIGTIQTDSGAGAADMGTLVAVQLRYASGPRDGQLRVILDPVGKKYAVCGGDL